MLTGFRPLVPSMLHHLEFRFISLTLGWCHDLWLNLVTLLLVRIGKWFINGSGLSSALGYGCLVLL